MKIRPLTGNDVSVPYPTPVFRILHIDNLDIILKRGAMYAGNFIPKDGLPYKAIHDEGVQNYRSAFQVPDGRCLLDFLPFYFGPRSPMLYRLSRNSVQGYNGGQAPIIYLVLEAHDFEYPDFDFLFTDAQANKAYTRYYDDLRDLDKLDWATIYHRVWHDTIDDNGRKGRKQAEFLVYEKCPLEMVRAICVYDEKRKEQTLEALAQYGFNLPVEIKSEWYY